MIRPRRRSPGRGFVRDRTTPVIELAQRGSRFVDAHATRVDFLAQRTAFEIIPEPAQRLQPLVGELLLREQLVVLQVRIDDLALDRVDAAVLSALELGELLLAFAILLLARELGRERLDASSRMNS